MSQLHASMRLVAMLGLFLCLSTWALSANTPPEGTAAKIAARLELREPARSLGQSATQLADGNWLLVGGHQGGRVSNRLVMLDRHFHPLPDVRAELISARSHHTATVLSDGSILVIGGVDASGQPIAAMERFHPESSELEVIGDMGVIARSQHTATLLMDGRVLIVGGVDVTALVHRDAQLLDPRTWHIESVLQQMVDERFGHAAALLPSDDVLLWNGRNQNQEPVSSVELYRRDASQFSRVESLERVLDLPYSSIEPRVNGTIPKAGAGDVAIDPQISVRFSKPLAVQTLNEKSVTLLRPSGPVESQIVGAEGGQLLFVTPKRQLLPGSNYTLFIQGATDAEDRPLPFTALGFTTRTFSAPLRPASSIPLAPIPQQERLNDADGELWLPTKRNYSGAWRSGNGRKLPQQMPKRASLAKALYGKQIKDKAVTIPKGMTALTGQVLKLNSTPLANVTLSIGTHKVATDTNGEFSLTNIPAGVQTLVIDGTTADRGRRHYGRYEYRALIEAKKTNALPFVIWMTRLDSEHEVTVPSPTPAEHVLTNPRIPGLELRIPKDTVILDARGNVVTEISMTAVPVDQPPFPLPNSFVPVYFTVQPGGAHLQGLNAQAAKGARLIYPNFSKASPGARMDFWNYDSRDRGWYVYGQGMVSSDGKQIVPDEGVVIYEFSGAMIALPNEAPPSGPPGPSGCGAGAGGGGGGAGGGSPPPPPGAGPSHAGDPVDCYTGLFLHRRVDLQIADVIPAEVLRTYRPNDTASRTFGIGTTLGYDIFLVGDLNPYTYQELIMPDGARIRYERTSPGTSWTDAVYANTTSPGEFFGSTLRWNTEAGTGWRLRLRNGTEYVFPEGAMLSARCNAPTSMRDRYGSMLTFTRESGCRLTTVTSHHGRRLNFAYDTSNRVTQVSDDIGRTVIYEYDTSGRLTTVTYPDNTAESYTYDASDRMLTVTDRRGNLMVTNAYDSNGRVSQQTYADNTTSNFAYTLDSNNKVVQTDYTDEGAVVRRIQFHASGLPSAIIRAFGKSEQQVVTFLRDPNTNQVQSVTDALGRVTTYQHDSQGNITQITYLSGTGSATTWQYTYEPSFSRVASITDPLNHTTMYNYDLSGYPTSSVDALNAAMTFTYNSNGQLATVSRALGSTAITTKYAYHGADLVSISDPLNRETRFFTDRVGRVVEMRDPLGNFTRFSYDASNRVSEITDATGHSTTFTYDGNDNLTAFEDARGNATSFSYDSRNRLTSRTNALSEVESYLYDAVGNRTRKTDRKGQVTGYEYDFLNRLTSQGFGATVSNPTSYTSNVQYEWDAGDRLVEVVDSASGTITREFDGLDRLLQEQSPHGTLSYSYFANGLKQSMTVLGQPTINYTYDAVNRLSQIAQGPAIVGFAYDTLNRRTTLTLVNGVEVAYGYDNASQLTSLTYQRQGTVLGDVTYNYDAGGRRTSVGGTFAQVGLPVPVSSAAYDDANRLTNWGSDTLSYDSNGALTSDTTALNYVWDDRERLSAIKQGATTVASFAYDALNRRIGRTIGGVTTSFLHDGRQVVQELVGGTPSANLLTGLRLDEIFRRSASSGVQDFLVDALGSTIALTNASGTIESTYSYEPYGAVTASGQSSSNLYQYTGRDNDGEIYYYRNRYYHPELHRFLSEDPIGLAGGQNVYAYVEGNPIRYTDPLGLQAIGEYDRYDVCPKGGISGAFCGACVDLGCTVSGTICCTFEEQACLGANAAVPDKENQCRNKFIECIGKVRKPKLPKGPKDGDI